MWFLLHRILLLSLYNNKIDFLHLQQKNNGASETMNPPKDVVNALFI